MKIRIKTYNGELPSYLTVGKVYEASGNPNITMQIQTDIGDTITVNMRESAFLNGGSWEVVSE